MIANIGRGENLIGALMYNQSKVDLEMGQVLATHNMIEPLNGRHSVKDLMRSFKPYLLANNRTEKPVLHISLNPDPSDKVSDEKYKQIADDYMEQMGYGEQPYVIFKHTDIDRTHIHIVTVCIDEQGKKISDSFEKRRSMEISRALEHKYGLVPINEKNKEQKEFSFRAVDIRKGNIKSQIASVIRYLPKYYKFQSLGEYNALLSLFNITAEEVKGNLHGSLRQGLVYFALDQGGEKATSPFKSSLFGKSAGYLRLQEHFLKSKNLLKENESIKKTLKNKIEIAMQLSFSEVDFSKNLLDDGINVVVRRNVENRIYGMTFIDHRSRTVWNGSRLGREFSASVFNDWWNHNKPATTVNNKKNSYTEQQASRQPLKNETVHDLFDFLNTDKTPYSFHTPGFIEGLGGIIPESQGEDYEELDFENQMKRKRRKKNR